MKVKKGFKAKFSISIRTITRIWSFGKRNINNEIDFTSKSFVNAGRKRIKIDVNMVKGVPFK